MSSQPRQTHSSSQPPNQIIGAYRYSRNSNSQLGGIQPLDGRALVDTMEYGSVRAGNSPNALGAPTQPLDPPLPPLSETQREEMRMKAGEAAKVSAKSSMKLILGKNNI